MRTPRVLLLILSASLLPAFAKQAWDVDDTTWTFTEAKLVFNGKAKGIGKVKAWFLGNGGVALNSDGTWTLNYIGSDMAAGTWAVEDEFDKSIELTLSPEGTGALFDFIEIKAEELALAGGFVVDAELDTLVLEKVRLFIKPNFKQQTARLKLVARFRATGLTDGEGLTDTPSTCKVKLKAFSDEVPLADVLP
jgi:hypothetical protein